MTEPLKPKIVIAGTGRAGTTLLVQIMTDLGFDTGFARGVQIDNEARAGLERNILSPTAPRVIKNPKLSTDLGGLLAAGKVAVEHVIIPVRDLEIAAASRVRASGYGRSLNAPGGMLWGVKRAGLQHAAVSELLAQLVTTVAIYELPHTFLHFPRFARDADYLFAQLHPLDPSLTIDQYREVAAQRFKPDFVHEARLNQQEQRKVRFNEPVTLYKQVNAGIRRRVRSLGK